MTTTTSGLTIHDLHAMAVKLAEALNEAPMCLEFPEARTPLGWSTCIGRQGPRRMAQIEYLNLCAACAAFWHADRCQALTKELAKGVPASPSLGRAEDLGAAVAAHLQVVTAHEEDLADDMELSASAGRLSAALRAFRAGA